MDSLEQQLTDLREQEQRFRAAAARGEAKREAAIAGLQAAAKALQDEFDVRPEDAPALLAKLEAEAQEEAGKARKALGEAQ